LLVEEPNALCLACHLSDAEGGTAGSRRSAVLKRAGLTEEKAAAFAKVSLSADQMTGHPQSSHPVAGSFPNKASKKAVNDLIFKGEMSCLSCHSSHGGVTRALFAKGVASGTQLCLKCHRK